MSAEPIFLQCQVGFVCGSEKQGFRPRTEVWFLGWVSHPLARRGACYPAPGSRHHGTLAGPSQSSRLQRQGGSFQREPDCNVVCLGVIINIWLFLREDQVRSFADFSFCFFEIGSMEFRLSWTSLCRPGLLPIQRSTCLSLWMLGLNVHATTCSWKGTFQAILCKMMCGAVHGG